MVDVLHKAGRAEPFFLVKDFIADRAALGQAIGGDHHAHVERVELGDEPVDALGGVEQSLRVAMVVDDRELGALHHVHRRHQRRVRAIVDDARRRELRRLAVARTHLGRARRAALTGLDRGTRGAATTAARRASLTSRRRILGERGGGDECEERSGQGEAAHSDSEEGRDPPIWHGEGVTASPVGPSAQRHTRSVRASRA